jgi:hypothetical protein
MYQTVRNFVRKETVKMFTGKVVNIMMNLTVHQNTAKESLMRGTMHDLVNGLRMRKWDFIEYESVCKIRN